MVAATLASLLVSFTLTPLIASRWLDGRREDRRRGLLARLRRASSGAALPARRAAATRRLLHWSLRHRPVVLLLAAVLVFGLQLRDRCRALGTEFVPESNRRQRDAWSASCRRARRWRRPTAPRSAGRLALLNHDAFPEIHDGLRAGRAGRTRLRPRAALHHADPGRRRAAARAQRTQQRDRHGRRRRPARRSCPRCRPGSAATAAAAAASRSRSASSATTWHSSTAAGRHGRAAAGGAAGADRRDQQHVGRARDDHRARTRAA